MKITNQIHCIKHSFGIPANTDMKLDRFVYSLVLFSKKITLIDCGIKGSEENIFDYILEHGRDIDEIETLILSHSHPDHIGAAAKIKALTNCKVLAHTAEKDWIENIDKQNQQRPVPGFYELVDEPVKIDAIVKNNQVFDASAGLQFKIIHTPGHSKGSLSFHFQSQKIIFTADAVPISGDIPNYDNYKDLLNSLDHIRKLTETDCEIMLSSWAEPVIGKSQIAEMICQSFGYLDMLNNAVVKYYAKPDIMNYENCKKLITAMKMPQIFINPIVHNAFLTHLI